MGIHRVFKHGTGIRVMQAFKGNMIRGRRFLRTDRFVCACRTSLVPALEPNRNVGAQQEQKVCSGSAGWFRSAVLASTALHGTWRDSV